MMRRGRRRYLTRSVAVLGGMLGTACVLGESPPPTAGPLRASPRRPSVPTREDQRHPRSLWALGRVDV